MNHSNKTILLIVLMCLLTIGSINGRGYRTIGDFERCQLLATRSLITTGTLSSPEFIKIDAEFRTKSEKSILQQDCFTETIDHKLLPKHSLLLPYLIAPLLPILGDHAILAIGLVVQFILIASIITTASSFEKLHTSLTLVTIFVFSQIIFYLSDIPYDTLSAACTVIAFSKVDKRPFLSGICLLTALFVRPTIILFAPFLLLLTLNRRENKLTHFVQCIFGLSLPAILYCLINHKVFGGFFQTAYHRLPEYHDGILVHAHHPIGFSASVFLSRWYDKLFNIDFGVIPYNLFLLSLLFSYNYLRQHKERSTMIIYIASSITYGLYIFSYEYWASTFIGNRFCMPSVALLLIPSCAYLSHIAHQYRPRS